VRAVVYAGPNEVRVEDVAPPEVREAGDAIVAVRKAAICASDLHLISGRTPGAREGAVIGHEFVGLITEIGDEVSRHHEGTRVLGSFLIACGTCTACAARRFNFCHERRALGLGELTGDLDGAQAEFVRVPGADVNLRTLDGGLAGLGDEEALLGGDVMTTGFYATSLGEITADDTVVVIGAGPVGLFCALAARRLSPKNLIVLDADPSRAKGAKKLGLETIDVSKKDAQGAIAGVTNGAMADVAIEAVGHTDALKDALKCVRDGGRVVVVGVYGTERYEMPVGMVWLRGIDLRFAGMANIQSHWEEALWAVAKGELDPLPIITDRLSLDEAQKGYEKFAARKALKVVLTP
jgi:threonine dehydrogenase-like Zn-dependent dehydrogenase